MEGGPRTENARSPLIFPNVVEEIVTTALRSDDPAAEFGGQVPAVGCDDGFRECAWKLDRGEGFHRTVAVAKLVTNPADDEAVINGALSCRPVAQLSGA